MKSSPQRQLFPDRLVAWETLPRDCEQSIQELLSRLLEQALPRQPPESETNPARRGKPCLTDFAPNIFNGRPSCTSDKAVLVKSRRSSRELSRSEGSGRTGLGVGLDEGQDSGRTRRSRHRRSLPGNRPGFDEVLQSVQSKQVGIVLGQDASRLARNSLDWALMTH